MGIKRQIWRAKRHIKSQFWKIWIRYFYEKKYKYLKYINIFIYMLVFIFYMPFAFLSGYLAWLVHENDGYKVIFDFKKLHPAFDWGINNFHILVFLTTLLIGYIFYLFLIFESKIDSLERIFTFAKNIFLIVGICFSSLYIYGFFWLTNTNNTESESVMRWLFGESGVSSVFGSLLLSLVGIFALHFALKRTKTLEESNKIQLQDSQIKSLMSAIDNLTSKNNIRMRASINTILKIGRATSNDFHSQSVIALTTYLRETAPVSANMSSRTQGKNVSYEANDAFNAICMLQSHHHAKRKEPFVYADLQELDFTYLNAESVSKICLMRLDNSNFYGAKLTNLKFRNVQLNNTSFVGADLTNSHFTSVIYGEFFKPLFDKARISGIKFFEPNISKTIIFMNSIYSVENPPKDLPNGALLQCPYKPDYSEKISDKDLITFLNKYPAITKSKMNPDYLVFGIERISPINEIHIEANRNGED